MRGLLRVEISVSTNARIERQPDGALGVSEQRCERVGRIGRFEEVLEVIGRVQKTEGLCKSRDGQFLQCGNVSACGPADREWPGLGRVGRDSCSYGIGHSVMLAHAFATTHYGVPLGELLSVDLVELGVESLHFPAHLI